MSVSTILNTWSSTKMNTNTNTNAQQVQTAQSQTAQVDTAAQQPRANLAFRLRTGVKAGRCCW